MKLAAYFAVMSTILPVAAQAQVSVDLFGQPIEKRQLPTSPMDGLWEQDVKGRRYVKQFFGGNYFALCEIDRSTSQINTSALGYYAIDQGALKERVRLAAEPWRSLRGDVKMGPIRNTGLDLFTQAGFIQKEDTWLRADSAAQARTLGPVTDFSPEITDLDGIWVMTSKQGRNVKVYDRGRYIVATFDPKKDDVVHLHLGIYSFDNHLCRERTLYASSGRKSMINGVIPIEVLWTEQGEIYQRFTNGTDQLWTRVGEKPKKGKFTGRMIGKN